MHIGIYEYEIMDSRRGEEDAKLSIGRRREKTVWIKSNIRSLDVGGINAFVCIFE